MSQFSVNTSVFSVWLCNCCGRVYSSDIEQPHSLINNSYQCEICHQLDVMEQENDC